MLSASALSASSLAPSPQDRPTPRSRSRRPRRLLPRPFLTPGKEFQDVSRGNPMPHTLQGDALVKARLTPESWRLEITPTTKRPIEKPLTLDANDRAGSPTCSNWANRTASGFSRRCSATTSPSRSARGSGRACRCATCSAGRQDRQRPPGLLLGLSQRRPEQMFQSSLAYQPGAWIRRRANSPPFVAYRLNGGPIPLERGGPVRMVVPWAHGFKSIKWLQQIVLTNEYKANDTYADSRTTIRSRI